VDGSWGELMSPQLSPRLYRRISLGLFFAFTILRTTATASAQSIASVSHPVSAGKSAPLPARVFVDAGGGYRFGTLDFSESHSDPYFAQSKIWNANYSVKNAPTLELGGGVRIWQNLTCAVAYSRFEDSRTASITGAVPNPFYLNRERAISGQSGELNHTEQTIHLSALWSTTVRPTLDVGVFGGPSIVALRQSFVSDVLFDDGYPYLTASFRQAVAEDVTHTSVGFNVGGQVAWYFNRYLGVSGTVRFSRTSATLVTAAGGSVPVTLGGLETIVGFRISNGRGTRVVDTRRARPLPEPPPPPASSPSRPAPPQVEHPVPALPSSNEQAYSAASAVGKLAIANGELPMFVRPGVVTPLVVFPRGTKLKILDDQDGWLMVEYQDRQWGRRVGFVRRDLVTISKQ
jgi:hypothetical protein